MPRSYSFLTTWKIRAPLSKVWEAIYESEKWPEWWKGVDKVTELVKGDEQGIGSTRIYTLSSPTNYKLTFTLVVTDRIDFELLKGNATGDLEGVGAWYFTQSHDVTTVECHWNVVTTISWMNRFSFLLAPFFSYNHKFVMRDGAKCLARKLKAELVSC